MSFSALILGRRRQGKSTLALMIACARSSSVLVVDPNFQYREWPGIPATAEAIRAELEKPSCLAIVRPDPKRIMEDWQIIAETAWDYEDYSLLIDEASMIQSAGWRDPWLERLLRQAPDSVSIIQTSHRPQDINKLSRALCTDLFAFRTTLEADLSLLADEFPGLKVDDIRKLTEYTVLHYWIAKGGYERNEVWRNPGEWFFNINGKPGARANAA